MNETPPAFTFERCASCGNPKTIIEAMNLEMCEDCEIDADLARKRPALFALFGLTV